MSDFPKHDEVVFFEVDKSRWADMEKLFESRGGPKNCWCMVWRGGHRANKENRKTAIKQFVEKDVPIGLLGYANNEPVAWCSIAPRSTYRDLGGMIDPQEISDTVWSLVCFFVSRQYRGQGMMPQLLHAAVEHARKRGATVVEAYPVEPDSPSYRFMGFVPPFKKYGFVEVGVAGSPSCHAILFIKNNTEEYETLVNMDNLLHEPLRGTYYLYKLFEAGGDPHHIFRMLLTETKLFSQRCS